MAELVSLRYPKKSHRKAVHLPGHSPELAEFFGIMMGDGGIGNPWQFSITINAIADKTYVTHVVRLITHLFRVEPHVVKRKGRNAVVIQVASTTIVDYLVENGLIRGDKLKGGLQIPNWILQETAFRNACVRGLMDTDGCLYIHKHMVSRKHYQNIGLCFSSYSPVLIQQVSAIFEEFSIIPHISNRGRSIYLYKADAVATYLEVFGTSNERISSVYENWRRRIVV